MGKNKLKRFADNQSYHHVFEPNYSEIESDTFEGKQNWHRFFGNDNPIVVELGCGKGEYTVGLAEHYPDKNFIGIDVKGARLWVGATYAKEKGLSNVAFIRSRVDFLASLFMPHQVAELWITFPDPQNKKRKKRLTYPRFLKMYQNILKPDGIVNLKTDSDKFYHYTKSVAEHNSLSILKSSDDLYHSDILDDDLNIKTFYESIFLDKNDNINFIAFKLDQSTLEDSDFDESLYENAVARIPHDKKLISSKLTE